MSRFTTRVAAGFAAAAAVVTLGALPASATTAEPAPTKLTVQADTARIDAGRTVTITGKLTSGAKPVGGVTVGISYCTDDFCGEFDTQPVTDPAGRYRATVTPVRSGHYRADFIPADDTLQPAGATTANIVVLQPSAISSFSAGRATAETVAVNGTIDFPRFTPATIPVLIEYLAPGSPCWTTAATVEAQWNGTTFAFSGTGQLQTRGLWRARYAGVSDEFHAATSAQVFVR
jgi:hypothetical protein